MMARVNVETSSSTTGRWWVVWPAEIPTGGASSFLVLASWAGMASSALLCANGIARLSQIALHPTSNTLQDWDSNTLYSVGILFVDAAGVASGIATLPFAMRNSRRY